MFRWHGGGWDIELCPNHAFLLREGYEIINENENE
jgi:hypothetical protein